MAGRRLNIVVGEDVYVELVRRYGVRGLSRGVDQLLRAAIFADNNVEAVGAQSPVERSELKVETPPGIELLGTLRRIYVTEQAYRMLARYCLERYGTLRGITRVASELLAEAISQKSIGQLNQRRDSGDLGPSST